MAKGDHIYIENSLNGIPFQHHGIDMGDGTVIHLASRDGARITLSDASDQFSVRRDSMDDFSRGQLIKRVVHEDATGPDQVAQSAESRLGQTGYHLLDGNCEHFATMCATGRSESQQIEMGEATLASATSMATKAFWHLSSKLGGRMAIRSAVKVHPAALLADGVEMATLAVGCRSGLSAKRTRRLARLTGTATAAGIGAIVAGPAGVAVGIAAHTSSSAIADSICERVRSMLSR